MVVVGVDIYRRVYLGSEYINLADDTSRFKSFAIILFLSIYIPSVYVSIVNFKVTGHAWCTKKE